MVFSEPADSFAACWTGLWVFCDVAPLRLFSMQMERLVWARTSLGINISKARGWISIAWDQRTFQEMKQEISFRAFRGGPEPGPGGTSTVTGGRMRIS